MGQSFLAQSRSRRQRLLTVACSLTGIAICFAAILYGSLCAYCVDLTTTDHEHHHSQKTTTTSASHPQDVTTISSTDDEEWTECSSKHCALISVGVFIFGFLITGLTLSFTYALNGGLLTALGWSKSPDDHRLMRSSGSVCGHEEKRWRAYSSLAIANQFLPIQWHDGRELSAANTDEISIIDVEVVGVVDTGPGRRHTITASPAIRPRRGSTPSPARGSQASLADSIVDSLSHRSSVDQCSELMIIRVKRQTSTTSSLHSHSHHPTPRLHRHLTHNSSHHSHTPRSLHRSISKANHNHHHHHFETDDKQDLYVHCDVMDDENKNDSKEKSK